MNNNHKKINQKFMTQVSIVNFHFLGAPVYPSGIPDFVEVHIASSLVYLS